MSAYDWSRFEVYLHVRAPAAAAWRAWATASGLESFFLAQARYLGRLPEEEAQPGDAYEWAFIHGPRMTGRVTEVTPGSSFGFTFGECLARVRFSERAGVTCVHLEQWNIPLTDEGRVEVHLSCRGAWIYFLTVLKARLELGVDARDHDPATAGSLAVWFAPGHR